MPKKKFPYDVLKQAEDVQRGWVQIDENLTFGPLGMGALVMDVNRLRGVVQSLAALEKQLVELRNQRDSIRQATWDKVKRARSGIKSFFGDDSSEYELVGGTPISERKRARRTKTAPAE